jgi:hypothetical protein
MQRCILFLIFGFLIIVFTPQELEAQYRGKRKKIKHRFNAGLIAGGNISQIDGDLYTGFDKAGLRGGLKGSMYLNDRLDMIIGFLYNQKGSRFEGPKGFITERRKVRKIHFDYMEVPFLLSIQLGEEPRDGKGYTLETGFSYARMVNYKITEVVYDPDRVVNYSAYADDFNPNEFNLIFGGNYFFNQHVGMGFHYTVQLNKVFDNPLERDFSLAGSFRNDPSAKVALLRNYQIAIQVVYNIF